MNTYMWFAFGSFIVCLLSCFYQFFRLIRVGKPKDFSKPLGEIGPAVRYAFSGAMDPRKKESAFLHLPTYTAGILYHLGTFLSVFLFLFFLFKIEPQGFFRWFIIGFLIISGASGFAILIKRIISKELRSLSNSDDFISNIIVTTVQLMTALALFNVKLFPVYFMLVSILLLYLPVGKLKHTIYFFAARYYLGLFFGWRGVWPPK